MPPERTPVAGVTLVTTRIETPLGPMLAAAADHGVVMLEFDEGDRAGRQLERLARRLGATVEVGTSPHLDQLRTELGEYFAGERRSFDMPLVLTGTTFQDACWTWLGTIPPGETRTYVDGAAAVGRPTAVRAFGAANASNPLAILVPCHRIVDSRGGLHGYGGGIERKRELLELEGALEPEGALTPEPAPAADPAREAAAPARDETEPPTERRARARSP